MKRWILATLALLVVALVICVTAWNLAGPRLPPSLPQRTDFEFTVSGALASRLKPTTRFTFWNPDPKIKGGEFALADLPVTLPFEQYRNQYWHVNFHGFSVVLSCELFDEPRAIDLQLDRPHPRLELTSYYDADLHYEARITEQACYCLLYTSPSPRD